MVEKQVQAENAQQSAINTEQEFLDTAYQNLDQQVRYYTEKLTGTRRAGASGTPSARSERDSFATHYEDNLARLKNVEHRLLLGRLDFASDTTIHIGRTTLRDDSQKILLTDWRAPQSEPFYQATSVNQLGVVRRRHIQTRFRKVTHVEDELLTTATELKNDLHLTGEGALFAAMNKARDGKMGDIVATIQAEQDRIIRSNAKGILVAQGGPGTGKTAVALHRAAYLLYTHRKDFAHSGVLVIGPSQRFLQYIDQVLPSLGESDVVACTIYDLFREVSPTITESPAVSEIKSRRIWGKFAQRAVQRILQKPLHESVTFQISGKKITLTPADVTAAQTAARRSGKPHNEAREKYARQLVELLANRLAQARQVDLADDEWILHEITAHPQIRRTINLHWLPASAPWLLAHLFKWPQRLAEVAPELSETERKLLYREKNSGFSPADIALLDELAHHLGQLESNSQRAATQNSAQQNAQMQQYVSQTLQTMNLGAGIVSAEVVQQRLTADTSFASLAERAFHDRTWTYGHVVVDEAQELTPMQWRMIARRNPRRSMTVVGDLDQRQAGAPRGGWAQTLGHLAENMRIERLTISYRTPREILDAAQLQMQHHGVNVAEIEAVREIPGSFQQNTYHKADFAAVLCETATKLLAELTAEYGQGYGTLALIAPTDLIELTQQFLAKDSALLAALEAGQISIIDPRESKGLEFDAVIVLNPDQIAAGGKGDLYVAMTRATKALRLLTPAA